MSAIVTEHLIVDSASPHIRFRRRPIAPISLTTPITPLINIIMYKLSCR